MSYPLFDFLGWKFSYPEFDGEVHVKIFDRNNWITPECVFFHLFYTS